MSKIAQKWLKENWIQIGYYGNRKINLHDIAIQYIECEVDSPGSFADLYPRMSEDLSVNTSPRKIEDPLTYKSPYDHHLKKAPGGYYEA